MLIISHRGINLPESFTESSVEAFESCLRKQFCLEFDINFSKDNKIFIFHDSNLTKITKNRDNFSDLTWKEIKSLKLPNGNFCDFYKLISLIKKYKNIPFHFLHLKGNFQTEIYLKILIIFLSKIPKDIFNKIIIFDVKIESAKYLKSRFPNIHLSPSVAHQHDIKRFNKYNYMTLISISKSLKYKQLYDWVWLDEWDRIDKNNKSKTFYNKKNFLILKKAKFKIGLVTPELHSKSINLLENKPHQDSKNDKALFKRIKEIINLKPDAICTDYSDKVKKMITTQ